MYLIVFNILVYASKSKVLLLTTSLDFSQVCRLMVVYKSPPMVIMVQLEAPPIILSMNSLSKCTLHDLKINFDQLWFWVCVHFLDLGCASLNFEWDFVPRGII